MSIAPEIADRIVNVLNQLQQVIDALHASTKDVTLKRDVAIRQFEELYLVVSVLLNTARIESRNTEISRNLNVQYDTVQTLYVDHKIDMLTLRHQAQQQRPAFLLSVIERMGAEIARALLQRIHYLTFDSDVDVQRREGTLRAKLALLVPKFNRFDESLARVQNWAQDPSITRKPKDPPF